MTSLAIFLALCLVALIWFIWAYNSFVRLQQLMKEGWSGIDIQLKRRYDLIPNLVATVKQYAIHEKGVLESVTAARSASMAAPTVGQKSEAETELSSSLLKLFAVAENYPDLKANQSFLTLQSELSSLESEIQLSRRYYNGAARNYNIAIQSFPARLVASLTHFEIAEYFQISAPERETPEVKFS